MPIAAALLAGADIVHLGDMLMASSIDMEVIRQGSRAVKRASVTGQVGIHTLDPKARASVMRSIEKSVPFDVQVASQLYWCGKKDYYRLDEDFGPMRLPYNDVWMEWSIPDQFIEKGKPSSLDVRALYAAHLQWIDVDQLTSSFPERAAIANIRDDAAGVVAVQMLSSSTDLRADDVGVIMMNECFIAFAVDDQGRYLDGTLRQVSARESISDDVAELLAQEMKSNCFVACMALNLINCRNVVTKPAGTVHYRRSGREKRQGKQPVRYHTIVLPGMTVERSHSSSRDRRNNESVLAAHVVRGHFKTFTPERPLLGRHVGTYWWNPAVRGNAKNGMVVSDYQVGEHEPVRS